MLLDNLPPEAAVWRADSPFQVTDPASLLAVLVERTDLWGRIAAFHTGAPLKGFKPKRLPEPIELRPKPKPRVLTDPGEISAALHRLMPGRG